MGCWFTQGRRLGAQLSSLTHRCDKNKQTGGETLGALGPESETPERQDARAQRDASYRKALLTEAVNADLGGDQTVGKAIPRGFVNATIGFEKLAAAVGIPSRVLPSFVRFRRGSACASRYEPIEGSVDEEWRRRESNPRPKTFNTRVYILVRLRMVSRSDPREPARTVGTLAR